MQLFRFFQVLSELIETEQKYVKDLQFLLAAYLEPLKKEHFWNYADLEQLYKNVKEIFVFQTKFLRILEESLESDPGFISHTSMTQFKVSFWILYVNSSKIDKKAQKNWPFNQELRNKIDENFTKKIVELTKNWHGIEDCDQRFPEN